MKQRELLTIIFGFYLLIQPLNAQTWTATSRLTWSSGHSFAPAIAIDSNGHIHVTWHDKTSGNYEILYKKSTNGGITWNSKRLTWNSGNSEHSSIAVDSADNVHVVWYDKTPGNIEIYYKKSTNAGMTWGAINRLTWNSGDSNSPVIAVDSNNHIHVVWSDLTPGNYEIFYRKSTNAGVTWGGTKRLSWNSGLSTSQVIAVDSNNTIHLVWGDNTPGNYEIFYKRSTNGGVNWTSKKITWTSGASQFPSIAIDSNDNIHLAWYDSTPGNSEIYYKRSTNGGVTWSSTKRLSWNASSSMYVTIAVDSQSRVHVSWIDFTPGNAEVFYKRSTDNGETWGGVNRLTWNMGYSGLPAIAVDLSDTIHIVWHDDIPGNFEIYYKKAGQ